VVPQHIEFPEAEQFLESLDTIYRLVHLSIMDPRRRLLNNALKLFAARGWDAVGVQEIVDASGVTKPTLYHYFSSKQGLLEALFEEFITPFFRKLERACEYAGDLPKTLMDATAVHLQFTRCQPDFYRLYLALYFTPPENQAFIVAAKYHDRQFLLMERVFEHASRNHAPMKGHHRRYAFTFLGMVNSYCAALLNGLVKLRPNMEHDIMNQFSYGIFNNVSWPIK